MQKRKFIFKEMESKDFETRDQAYKYQKKMARQEDVKVAILKQVYNIHTSEWQYRVDVEYREGR